jgi:hypothetical protein
MAGTPTQAGEQYNHTASFYPMSPRKKEGSRIALRSEEPASFYGMRPGDSNRLEAFSSGSPPRTCSGRRQPYSRTLDSRPTRERGKRWPAQAHLAGGTLAASLGIKCVRAQARLPGPKGRKSSAQGSALGNQGSFPGQP